MKNCTLKRVQDVQNIEAPGLCGKGIDAWINILHSEKNNASTRSVRAAVSKSE